MMPLPSFDLAQPRLVEDAIALLAEAGDEGRIIAGGTDLLVNMKQPFGTKHNLAKFRFSVTDARGEVRYIEMSDSLMAALDSPPKERGELFTRELHSMFINAEPELAKKIRLAGARDITWALLNSPAFLYNR